MSEPLDFFVVMGVSGCGKSSVARLLAERTGGLFLDADDFHPESNRAKMSAGIPLTDEDRWGWLDTLNGELQRLRGKTVFLACSALRAVYRERLSAGLPGLRFIYLKGSREEIQARLTGRKNHFMPASLLDSQFAFLEEPQEALTVSISDPLPVIIENILGRL